ELVGPGAPVHWHEDHAGPRTAVQQGTQPAVGESLHDQSVTRSAALVDQPQCAGATRVGEFAVGPRALGVADRLSVTVGVRRPVEDLMDQHRPSPPRRAETTVTRWSTVPRSNGYMVPESV